MIRYDPDEPLDFDDPEGPPDESEPWDDGWYLGGSRPFSDEDGAGGGAGLAHQPEAGELAGVRAVVVEEDPVDRRLLQGCLDFLGCESVVARSGEEAVTLLSEAPRDVLFADASLAGMAGGRTVDTARRAARAAAPSRGGSLVVVAVAERMDEDLEEELRAAGFDACLRKPAELGRVAELLRGLVGPGSGHDPGTGSDGREITSELDLTSADEARIELHTFLNVLNLLSGQLQLLRRDLGGGAALARSRERTERLLEEVRAGFAGGDLAGALKELEADVREETEAALSGASREDGAVDRASAREVLGNTLGILAVAHTRAADRAGRSAGGRAWEEHSASGLTEDVMTFLAAVQRNARERYHIVHDPAAQEAGDYLVRLTIEGEGGDDTLRMPPVVADVFRDLVANARKYTPPGGVIAAELVRRGEELRVVVADSGMGIPEGEVERVVELGYRARNARERDTWGGGFGLTKAYAVTRALGGRLWIDSEPGRGTRVVVRIPVPEEER